MENNLRKLYNTLLLIETKGENTKIMSDCLRYTEQLIADCMKIEATEGTNMETEV